jgi:hypothetical protein
VDESVAFLLHVLVELRTELFAVQVAPEMFLDLPPVWQQFLICLPYFIYALLHVLLLSELEPTA